MPVEIPGVISASEAPGMQEAKEIMSWYLYLIQAKIMRALHGQVEEEGSDRFLDIGWSGSGELRTPINLSGMPEVGLTG